MCTSVRTKSFCDVLHSQKPLVVQESPLDHVQCGSFSAVEHLSIRSKYLAECPLLPAQISEGKQLKGTTGRQLTGARTHDAADGCLQESSPAVPSRRSSVILYHSSSGSIQPDLEG